MQYIQQQQQQQQGNVRQPLYFNQAMNLNQQPTSLAMNAAAQMAMNGMGLNQSALNPNAAGLFMNTATPQVLPQNIPVTMQSPQMALNQAGQAMQLQNQLNASFQQLSARLTNMANWNYPKDPKVIQQLQDRGKSISDFF